MGKSRERPEHYEQEVFDLSGLVRPRRRLITTEDIYALHQALKPFIDLEALRRLAASGQDIYTSLRIDKPPREVRALLDTIAAVLRPVQKERIRAPADVAAFLMVEMGGLEKEELRTVLLDTKNHIQAIPTIYKGSVNTVMVRIGEVFKEALRYNSTSLILVHNHPSSIPEPSTEDILLTKSVVQAGKLLDIECVDHVILGQGKWVSLRERGLW